MIALRLLRLLMHVCGALLTGVTLFPLYGRERQARYIRQWSVRLLAICGIEVRVGGAGLIDPNALIVANHASWLDIYLIKSVAPIRFIAKASIRSWPLIGWLSKKSGTVFIERGSQRDLKRTFQNLVTELKAGERFAIFPEGTTAAQGRLLPFHPNLFEAAIDAGRPVQPCAIRYVDANGRFHPAIDFSDDRSFMKSVINVLKARGIIAHLTVLPPMDTAGKNRRELAQACHTAVAEALSQGDYNLRTPPAARRDQATAEP